MKNILIILAVATSPVLELILAAKPGFGPCQALIVSVLGNILPSYFFTVCFFSLSGAA